MKKLLQLSLFILLISFSACREDRNCGCRDQTAANYDASANCDATCNYEGQVVFFFASYTPNTGTVIIDGLTGTFTYHSSASYCGAAGDATFTLPVGNYNYSLSTWASSTSGSVTVTKNGCAQVGW